MAIPFLDRDDEQRRLRRFLGGSEGGLAVLYGRRRCGKSTLLQRVCGDRDVYFLADQREPLLQIQAFAAEVARVIPEFATPRYPSWDSLLTSLHAQVEGCLNLMLDEFPYLAAASPELPSLIQTYLDRPGRRKLKFVLCGSSQRMMQGLVLDRTAPLYGRAKEILRLAALPPGWIRPALGLEAVAAIEAWAVWGGVPRYWELAREHPTLEEAMRELVLHRNGVLHDEPQGLLLDDMRSTSQAASLLALVGAGCNRLSEIAARMGKPSGSLTRPLSNLIDLGYVHKEVPFGESERSSKRTLYRIKDPFLAFWFRFLLPARSLLERDVLAPVEARIRERFPSHVGAEWEALARQSVPVVHVGDVEWGPAARWWGAGPGGPMEFDVVAESLDGKSVLVGEVKWAAHSHAGRRGADLRSRAAGAPFVQGRRLVHALWLKEPDPGEIVVTPEIVLDALV